jgi:hypothetical protein
VPVELKERTGTWRLTLIHQFADYHLVEIPSSDRLTAFRNQHKLRQVAKVAQSESIPMKLLSGAILLVGCEQAFAHALLIPFPNQDTASRFLIPASLVMLVMGSILMIWGLLTELRRRPERALEERPPE